MINHFDIPAALTSLCPGAQWSMVGNSWDGLTWVSSDIPCPTFEEVEAERSRLMDEYNATQYQRDRAKAYPDIKDQLDTLFHEGIDGWKAQIQAIKDKYPKSGKYL